MPEPLAAEPFGVVEEAEATERTAGPEKTRVFAPRAARSLAPEWGEHAAEPPAPEIGPQLLERFSGLRGRREEIAEARAAREAVAVPTIRVHIGRIEIRPLGEKPREKTRAQEATVSLEDYLRERRRESW